MKARLKAHTKQKRFLKGLLVFAALLPALFAASLRPMRAQDAKLATAGPPKFLNMVHQELKPGRVWEYDELETSIARIYTREGIPVYWLELESITGPSEVLYLNLFDSAEDLAKSEKASSAALAAHP